VAVPPPRRLGKLIRAATGSAVFFAVAPGVVAGLIPYWLTGWRFLSPVPGWTPVRVAGALVTLAAAVFLVSAFVRFVVEGLGTPAPVSPTEHLVVGGVYRYVRNPMYVAVIAAIAGQALLFGQLGLLAYAFAAGLAMFGFVKAYEEPYLADRFGAEYDEYRRAVPGWWPRLRPWER
jgi:protein-S-isoprenylcysteine O-methyltransferase Ste14